MWQRDVSITCRANSPSISRSPFSPWPLQTADAVKAFAEENARQGSKDYDLWLIREKHLRERLAQLINSPSTDEIALLKSTSEGLSVIAYGLPWQSADNIVIPAEEFPSNRIVWQSLDSLGVETRLIPVCSVDDPEQAFDIETPEAAERLLQETREMINEDLANRGLDPLDTTEENALLRQVDEYNDGIRAGFVCGIRKGE